MNRFLLICLGGAFGSGARYLVGLWAVRILGSSFPWGTFIVNVLGCFLLSVIVHSPALSRILTPTTQLALTVGVMGGFTTYSSFNYEAMSMFRQSLPWRGVLYMGATIVACFLAGLLGLVAARTLAVR